MSDSTDLTLREVLFKLSSFLPPEATAGIVHQIQRAMPTDISGGFDAPHLYGSLRDSESLVPPLQTAQAAHIGPSNFLELAANMDILQQVYPARAAAVYLRVLLNVLANLFEQKAMHRINDEFLSLIIDGLLRSEAILDAHCTDCPKSPIYTQ